MKLSNIMSGQTYGSIMSLIHKTDNPQYLIGETVKLDGYSTYLVNSESRLTSAFYKTDHGQNYIWIGNYYDPDKPNLVDMDEDGKIRTVAWCQKWGPKIGYTRHYNFIQDFRLHRLCGPAVIGHAFSEWQINNRITTVIPTNSDLVYNLIENIFSHIFHDDLRHLKSNAAVVKAFGMMLDNIDKTMDAEWFTNSEMYPVLSKYYRYHVSHASEYGAEKEYAQFKSRIEKYKS